eukprot:TRINITY_DN21256_c0_g2_i1.p1 TRINITY_DN21256_c0_g2~~TRINITY_DN21256_c0_g2_i1.p1  ORF type:complete len:737 (-),score=132.57 TRINITY_DN21256_c0_g2_i1:52-2262(-)
MAHGILLFYQFADISDKQALVEDLDARCRGANLSGRLRVSGDGVNGCLSGTVTDCKTFYASLREDLANVFATTDFKLGPCEEKHLFRSLKVWQNDEVCGLFAGDDEAIESNRELSDLAPGQHVDPETWHHMLSEGNSDIVLFDVRNRYETRIGKFAAPLKAVSEKTNECESARSDAAPGEVELIDPLTRFYYETPGFLQQEENLARFRGKRVMMYCTGGVRCERASALLKKQLGPDSGSEIFQLSGGIQRYMEAYPSGGFFEGSMYVFDRRGKVSAAEAGLTNSEFEQGQQSSEANCCVRQDSDAAVTSSSSSKVIGRCSECGVAWDNYQGRWPCGGCGMPLLLCSRCQGRCSGLGAEALKAARASLRCEICDPSKLCKTTSREPTTSLRCTNESDAKSQMLISKFKHAASNVSQLSLGDTMSDDNLHEVDMVMASMLKHLDNRQFRTLLAGDASALDALRLLFKRLIANASVPACVLRASSCVVVADGLLRDASCRTSVLKALAPEQMAVDLLQCILKKRLEERSNGDGEAAPSLDSSLTSCNAAAVRVFWRLAEDADARRVLLADATAWRTLLSCVTVADDVEVVREACVAWRVIAEHSVLNCIAEDSAAFAFVCEVAEHALATLQAQTDNTCVGQQAVGQAQAELKIKLKQHEKVMASALAAARALCQANLGYAVHEPASLDALKRRVVAVAEATASLIPDDNAGAAKKNGKQSKAPAEMCRWAQKLLDELRN